MFFNGDDIDERSCLRPGAYNAVILIAEHSENKAGTGSYVKVAFEIIDEGGFSVFNWYNIEHENVKVQAMGKKDFKKLVVAATGNGNLERLDDLVGKKVGVTLGEQEYMGSAQNMIKDVKNYDPTDVPF